MAQDADAPNMEEKPLKKRGLMPILIGMAGALVLGGGGFYAVYSGLILGGQDKAIEDVKANPKTLPTYLAIEQLTLSLAEPGGAEHLRLSAHVEIADGRLDEAEAYRPRFLSVINTYLRAVEPDDLREANALIRLRAQILRRLQMVAGADLVDDFLITEFILN